MDARERYLLNDPDALLSPSLLIFRDLVRGNLDAMLGLARGPERLRPHVKTHKMPALVRMVEEQGIRKHKCATIAEAEMVARAGGSDVLLSYPLVGPNNARMARLARTYPGTAFRAVVDHPEAARALSAACQGLARPLPVLIDLDIGMGRTGIAPGDAAAELYALLDRLPNLTPDGLHAYDGHIRGASLAARRDAAREGQEQALGLRDRLRARGLEVPRVVLGGTPTFPVHSAIEDPDVELSPGTCIFHDAGYARSYPDLPFTPAALVLTRVVSRPRPGRVCLDLGHKAIAPDPPAGSRFVLLGVPEPTIGTQNEEHLIVDTPAADRLPPGTPLLALPTHICPTCALHQQAYVLEGGELVDRWAVGARDRVLEI